MGGSCSGARGTRQEPCPSPSGSRGPQPSRSPLPPGFAILRRPRVPEPPTSGTAQNRLRPPPETSIHGFRELPTDSDSLTLIAAPEGRPGADFAGDVRAGLTACPKRLPCLYFYDERGSRLFERICELPEYYLTRAERSILEAHADDLAALLAGPVDLVDLGSGNSGKTRLVIEALLRCQGRLRFIPVDISSSMLQESSLTLVETYPGLEVLAVAGEYQDGLDYLEAEGGPPRLVLWLGSNVGNFTPREAVGFLRRLGGAMRPGDALLIGIDLRKEPAVLVAAYDDAAGVTAQFNLNLLARINRELGGRFDLDAFAHEARWNEAEGRMEMHLRSLRGQSVRIEALGLDLAFAEGETIHTESSCKYSLEGIQELAAAAGFAIERQWLDGGSRFSLSLMTRGGASGN